MKAKIKKTGEIIEVFKNKHDVYIDKEHRGHSAESLDFMFDEETHWQDVRERAAIAAMQGIMNFFGSLDYNRETIANLAVKQADALIKELKGELPK